MCCTLVSSGIGQIDFDIRTSLFLVTVNVMHQAKAFFAVFVLTVAVSNFSHAQETIAERLVGTWEGGVGKGFLVNVEIAFGPDGKAQFVTSGFDAQEKPVHKQMKGTYEIDSSTKPATLSIKIDEDFEMVWELEFESDDLLLKPTSEEGLKFFGAFELWRVDRKKSRARPDEAPEPVAERLLGTWVGVLGPNQFRHTFGAGGKETLTVTGTTDGKEVTITKVGTYKVDSTEKPPILTSTMNEDGEEKSGDAVIEFVDDDILILENKQKRGFFNKFTLMRLKEKDVIKKPARGIDGPEEEKPASKPRTWEDSTGRFTVEATLVSIVDGVVTLKRVDNGKVIKVPTEILSTADQAYIQGLKQ